MGRLLFTLWLCQQKILSQPVLYLSYYFKRNRTEYYDHLMAIRHDGKWEERVKFFLKGVTEIANESSDSARQIDALREEATGLINSLDAQTAVNARKLLDQLFITPQMTRRGIAVVLGVSAPTAGALAKRFCDLDILVDVTPHAMRNKKFAFKQYLNILEVGTE
jgi:Fic family protein